MKWFRSLLFVPGNKPDWVEKAWKANPDGIIIDLEDSVPATEKGNARKETRHILEEANTKRYYCVRINSLSTALAYEDLKEVVHPNLNAIMVPKVYKVEDLTRIDEWLSALEIERGIKKNSIALPLLIETALCMRNAYDIAISNIRVDTILMSAGEGGDAQRAIGYQWSKSGTETLFLRSKIVLDARAANVTPLINSWYDIKDEKGLIKDAMLNRSLGYTGMAVIHPKHVKIVNDIFTPTRQEINFYKGLLEAFTKAEKEGHATAVYEGNMIDNAMAETARQFLLHVRILGIIY